MSAPAAPGYTRVPRGASPRACPYQGLAPFGERDAPFFFGRDVLRDVLIANLMASRLTLMFGPSGRGQDLPAPGGRRQGAAGAIETGPGGAGPASFRRRGVRGAVERPGRRAAGIDRLGVAGLLGEEAADPPPAEWAPLERLRAWTERADADLLVILDQFEEYFGDHPDETENLAAELGAAVADRELRVNFLLSMRDDAIAQLDRLTPWIPKLYENRVEVERLDWPAAESAILRPLERYNELSPAGPHASIDQALVEQVLSGVQAGRLAVGGSGRAGEGGHDEADAMDRFEAPFLQLLMEARSWRAEADRRQWGGGRRASTSGRRPSRGWAARPAWSSATCTRPCGRSPPASAASRRRPSTTWSRRRARRWRTPPTSSPPRSGKDDRALAPVLRKLHDGRILRAVSSPGYVAPRYELSSSRRPGEGDPAVDLETPSRGPAFGGGSGGDSRWPAVSRWRVSRRT